MIQTAVTCDKGGCQARAAWDNTKLTSENAANHYLLRSAVESAGWTAKSDPLTGRIQDFCPEHSK